MRLGANGDGSVSRVRHTRRPEQMGMWQNLRFEATPRRQPHARQHGIVKIWTRVIRRRPHWHGFRRHTEMCREEKGHRKYWRPFFVGGLSECDSNDALVSHKCGQRRVGVTPLRGEGLAMRALEFAHEVDERFYAGFGHGVVDGGAHAADAAVTFQVFQTGRFRSLHELGV